MPDSDNKNINREIQQAFQYLKKGNQSEAQATFNEIVAQPVKDINNLSQLGSLASQLGEKVAAINIYSEILERFPDSPVHMDNLAQAYIDNGMLLQAEKMLNKAIEINPNLHLPYIRLSGLAIAYGNFAAAVEPLEKALQIKPSDPAIYTNLVTALTHSGRPEEAYDYAQKLVRLEPNKAESYHMLGRILNGLGKFDEAVSNFEKSIRLDKTFGYSYLHLSSIKKFSSDDDAFIKQAEKTLEMSMPAIQRSSIHFSLGKIYNDCKEWDKAFEHYDQGNLIGKPAICDMTAEEVFKKTHKTYTRKLFQKTEGLGSDSDIPVFVVGMPRSGTTLIEQIIASHPEGAGAGELTNISRLNDVICKIENLDNYKKELTRNIDEGSLIKHTESYLEVLRSTREDASRVVDKMPDNFLFLGLINILFPNAHIIHAVRSPLDTCLSCYFQFFRDVSWSYDLEWVAKRYKFYRKAMDYWESVLPENKIIEVRYENMIADPEAQAKRLIESIGLQWDPTCLEFYNEKRSVNTASLWQVRQPVYKSSSKRWLNYGYHIEKLANDLQEFLEDDEVEELIKQGMRLKKKWNLNIFK